MRAARLFRSARAFDTSSQAAAAGEALEDGFGRRIEPRLPCGLSDPSTSITTLCTASSCKQDSNAPSSANAGTLPLCLSRDVLHDRSGFTKIRP